MPIDPGAVKWDDAPHIDPDSVKWDEADPSPRGGGWSAGSVARGLSDLVERAKDVFTPDLPPIPQWTPADAAQAAFRQAAANATPAQLADPAFGRAAMERAASAAGVAPELALPQPEVPTPFRLSGPAAASDAYMNQFGATNMRAAAQVPLLFGGMLGTLGDKQGADASLAKYRHMKELADKASTTAANESKLGTLLGGLGGFIPQTVSAPTLALGAVAQGTDPAATALERGKDLSTAMGLYGVGAATGAAQVAAPVAVPGSLAVRALTGAAINGATGTGGQALQHALAPDIVEAPTADDAALNAGIGALMGAALGHGREPRMVDEVPGARLEPDAPLPALPAPEPVVVAGALPHGADFRGEYTARRNNRQPAPATDGPVVVNARGEAFTPAQGHEAFSQALARARGEDAPQLGAPVTVVDSAGNAQTSRDYLAQVQQAQAEAQARLDATQARRDLGLTPDVERAQAARQASRGPDPATVAWDDTPAKTDDVGMPPDAELAEGMRGQIGWEQVGGKMIRHAGDGEASPDAGYLTGTGQGDVRTRTTWIDKTGPNGERGFWSMRPETGGRISEAGAHAALDKFSAGQRLNAKEQRFIDYAVKTGREDWLAQQRDYQDMVDAHPDWIPGFDYETRQPEYGDTVPFSRRAKDDATDDMLGGSQPQRQGGEVSGLPLRTPRGGDLFAAPTAAERNRAATQAKDAQRNGLAGGRADAGDGGLFDGPRPEQMSIPDAPATIRGKEPGADAARNLRRFMAGSKAVKPDGSPLTVYHGTNEDFWTFDGSRAGAATAHSTAPLGHFFDENLRRAKHYAENAADGVPAEERVIDAHLAIKNPAEWTMDRLQRIDTPEKARAIRRNLEASGFDGIHIKDAGQWIAFKPEQIKSASANLGTFDPASADMRYSRENANLPATSTSHDTYPSGVPKGLPVESTAATVRLETVLNRGTSAQGASGGASAPARIMAIPRARLPHDLARALAGLEELGDLRVEVIRSLNPKESGFDPNGVTLREGVLYVAENAQHPVVHVAGHEFTHQLKKDRPDLYRILEDEWERQGRKAEWAAEADKRGYRPHEFSEEALADGVGDAMADPEFMERMAQQNPSAFRRIAEAFKAFLDNLLAKLGRIRDHGSAKYWQDVQAFRDKLADVLDRYARDERGMGGERGGEGDPAYQRAWHGTPHRGIEKTGFKLDKIGTGEGAQAYGWGMYFAGKREIAEHYRRGLSTRDFINKARDAYDEYDSPEDAIDALRSIEGLSEPQKELLDALQADGWLGFDYPHQAISAALKQPQNFELSPATETALAKQGNLYHVEVPEDHDLLDWDKPLSQQPDKVREVMRGAGFPSEGFRDPTGKTMYGRMVLDVQRAQEQGWRESIGGIPVKADARQAVSEYLNGRGIPGLRYLDGTSRAKGEGSANYVIWDESRLNNDVTPYYARKTDEQQAGPGRAPGASRRAPDDDAPMFSRREPDEPDMPSRRPGESQESYARRVMNRSKEDIRAATALAKLQRKIGRQDFRAMLAKRDRQLATADHAFAEVRKTFDKAGKHANLQAIDEWENGAHVTSVEARQFFASMKDAFDQRIERIRSLAPDAMQQLIENYFPHIWEDSSRALKWYQSMAAKRPLEGNKSFLKQRTWGTIKEGMASGLKPVSTNPVDLALLKLEQMDKFITLHEFRQGLQQRGWLRKMEAGQRVPEGYARIDDPAFQISGGLQGYYAAPELIAKDVNNYLGPSLYRYGAWKGLRTFQNTLMSARLGWSMFHAGFTTTDNLVLHVDVAARRFMDGDIAGGLKLLAKAPLTIALSPYEGGVLNKEWLGLKEADPNTAAVLDMLEQGGARWKMSATDYNNALPKLMKSIRERSATGVLKEMLPAVGEASSYIIHHWLVPNQKMAARVMLAKFELDRMAGKLGKERGDYAGITQAMHPDTLRQIAAHVVDLIDDRLGQMNYDNQFWNKTAREVAQAMIGAVGWQVGTVRTVTGGARDVLHLWKPEKLVAPLDKGGKINDADMGRVSGRLTYLLSLALMMGGLGAVTQYLLTGEGPQEVKDYFFPKTGRKNDDGSDERLQYPSYWMDHYKLATHPLQTAMHKIHPSIGMMMEAIANQDYYGVRIRDEDAPWYKQAAQVGEYVAKGFLPYSVTGHDKLKDASTGRKVANFFGVTAAPASVSRTKFQAFVAEKAYAAMPKGSRTQEQADKSQRMHDAEAAMRRGETPDWGDLNNRDQRNALKAAKDEVPAIRFRRLGLQDKLRAYDMATPDEREQYHLRAIIMRSNWRDAVRNMDEGDRGAVMDRMKSLIHKTAPSP